MKPPCTYARKAGEACDQVAAVEFYGRDAIRGERFVARLCPFHDTVDADKLAKQEKLERREVRP